MPSMRIEIAITVAISTAISVSSSAQVPAKSDAHGRPQDAAAPTVSEVLRRVDSGEYSQLLAMLRDPDSASRLGLTEKQSSLVQRLDGLARGIIRGWLVYNQGSPDAEGGARRLSESEVRNLDLIRSHLEAMASQGILTSRQVSMVPSVGHPAVAEGTAQGKASVPLLRRTPRKRAAGSRLSVEEADELKREVRNLVSTFLYANDEASDYFATLRSRQVSRRLELSAEQSRLIKELNLSTRSVIEDWLTRGLDAASPPPDLEDRLSENGMLRMNRIVRHAEIVAQLGILTPTQAEAAKKQMWVDLGARALLDPEVAARLRLRPEQKEEVAARIDRKRRIRENAEVMTAEARWQVFGTGGKAAREADLEVRRIAREADDFIWDALEPSQVDRLEKLLGTKVKSPRP